LSDVFSLLVDVLTNGVVGEKDFITNLIELVCYRVVVAVVFEVLLKGFYVVGHT